MAQRRVQILSGLLGCVVLVYCSFLIIIPRARAASRGLFTRAMPVSCSPQIDQLGQSCFVGPFLGHLGLSWAILASSWHDLWSSWCQERPPTSKMSLSAPPGGADHLVNYEVFGTSSYSCCFDVLCFLGSMWGAFFCHLEAILDPSCVVLALS